MRSLLKEDIGINAGKIWRLLQKRGLLSIRQIGELTYYHESVIYMCLGWLARENKIKFLNEGGNVQVHLV